MKKCPDFCLLFSAYKKEVKTKLQQAKVSYHLTLDRKWKTNPKEFWKFIKTNRRNSAGILPVTVDEGILIDGQEKASAFNQCFKSAFSLVQKRGNP